MLVPRWKLFLARSTQHGIASSFFMLSVPPMDPILMVLMYHACTQTAYNPGAFAADVRTMAGIGSPKISHITKTQDGMEFLANHERTFDGHLPHACHMCRCLRKFHDERGMCGGRSPKGDAMKPLKVTICPANKPVF